MPPRTRFDKNYYQVMGLHPEATDDEIRKTYRRLALRWHPDRNPGDAQAEERFKEISEAYAVLIDPAKRREYDASRRAGTGEPFRHSREDIFRDLFANPGASDVFEELAREFERMGMRVDRHYFRQTLFGGRAVVTGGVFVVTPFTPALALLRLARAALAGALAAGGERSGTRTDAITGRPELRPLPGAARVLTGVARLGRWLLGLPAPAARHQAAREDVMLRLALTTGEAERGGTKRVLLNHGNDLDELLVKIPAGIRSGAKLRLRGKGRPRPDGSRGDVFLVVEIA